MWGVSTGHIGKPVCPAKAGASAVGFLVPRRILSGHFLFTMEHGNAPEGQVKHVTVGLILSWALGVLLLLAGFGMCLSNPLSGILVLIAGAIMLPPVSGLIEKHSKLHLSGGVRFIIAIVLCVVATVAMPSSSSTASNSANSGSGSTSTSAPAIEIVDISTRVTESNSVWSKFAWNLTLKNNTDRDRTVNAVIKWVDKDGFVVDSDNEYNLRVPANSEKTFNDYQLIDASSVPDVEGVKAEVR